MAWRTRYGSDYSGSWYNRGAGYRDFEPGSRAGSGWQGSYGAYPSRNTRYGYDYEFRQPPSQSPAYGRGGDRQVRQWARNHGYDEGFRVQPHEGGGWSQRPTNFDRYSRPRRYDDWRGNRDSGSFYHGYRW